MFSYDNSVVDVCKVLHDFRAVGWTRFFFNHGINAKVNKIRHAAPADVPNFDPCRNFNKYNNAHRSMYG